MKSAWEDDNIQFARLLAEIRAVGLTNKQYRDLMDSMDLTRAQIDELLTRADNAFERIVAEVKG